MELIDNLLQFLAAFSGAVLSGIAYRKSRRQTHFLLLFCFYGCFALGALYWTLYLLWVPFVISLVREETLWILLSSAVTVLHCVFYMVNMGRWAKKL